MNQVTACITTFDRPECAQRLVASIREFYPELAIIVADYGETGCRVTGTRVDRLPYDVGLSAARNYLLAVAPTKYIVMLDDDMVFERETRLETLKAILEGSSLDMVGGQVCDENVVFHHWRFSRRGDVVDHYDDPYYRFGVDGATAEVLDFVPNFWMAKTHRLRMTGGWRPDLKVGEHFEFFWRCKNTLRVGYVPQVTIRHCQGTAGGYERHRGRQAEMWQRVRDDIGIRNVAVQTAKPKTSLADGEKTLWFYWENMVDGPAFKGPWNLPPYIELCLQSIRQHLDGWRLRVLDEKSIREWITVPAGLERKVPHPGQRTDYLRAKLLYEHGGMWIDADTIVLRDLGFMLELLRWQEVVFSRNQNGNAQTWFLAARAGSDTMRRWLVSQQIILDGKEEMKWTDLGSHLLTEAVRDRGHAELPARTVGTIDWKDWTRLLGYEPCSQIVGPDTVAVSIFNRLTGRTLSGMKPYHVFSSGRTISRLFRMGVLGSEHLLECWRANPIETEAERRECEKLVTVLIVTFNRPEHLGRCLVSVAKFYPKMRILVADNGSQRANLKGQPRLDYEKLPFDCGLSKARNHLLAKVRTKFFLLLDDDMILTPFTRIHELLRAAIDEELDVVGGMPVNGHGVQHFEGMLDREAGTLHNLPRFTREEDGLYRCDVVMNFFLGRTGAVRRVHWDPKLKMGEHEDFFLRAQAKGLKVAYLPAVSICHHQNSDEAYLNFRNRAGYEFLARMMDKHGLERMEYFNGTVIERKGLVAAGVPAVNQ